MKEITFKIKSAEVLLTSGQDHVILHPEGLETAHPEMKYPVSIEIRARYDYGVEWCKKVLDIEAKAVNVRNPGL